MTEQKIKLDYFRNVLKHLLIFFLPLSILMGSILTFYYLTEVRTQKSMLENSANHQVKMTMEALAAEYMLPISDLNLLALAAKQNFQKISKSGYTDEWINLLTDNFSLIISSRGAYDQIRFINRKGMERIKVEYKNGRSYVIPEEKLQSKAHRYYFRIANALGQDEIYASPFDLNIEHGEIERPLNPVIRFATPVFDQQGNRQGIIILNYKGQELLENLKDLSSNIPGNIMIANSGGFWLLGARPEDEWGFMLEERKDKIFGRSYPEAWKRIATADSGKFSNTEGIFSFNTSHTLHSRQKLAELESDVPKRNHYIFKTEEKYWKVIYHVPPNILKVKFRNLKNKLLLLFLVISAPLAAGTWFLAHIKIKFETRRKETEMELRNSKERLHTITSSANDAIIMMDDEGIVSYWNPAAKKIFGFSSEEMIGKEVSKFIIPEKHREAHNKGVLAFKETGGQGSVVGKTVELVGLRKNREEFHLELSLSSIKHKDRWHAVGIVRDITERKIADKMLQMAQDDLADKAKKLEKLNEDLKKTTAQLVQSEKLTALGELTGGVAHELNQPLNVIKIICQSQLRDIKKGRFEVQDVEQDLPEIVDQVNRMAGIIDHMRVFSRQTDREESKENFDVSKVVEDSFKFIEQQFKSHNIEIIRELLPDLPIVYGDPIRIEQVMLNLLSNARNTVESSGKADKRIEVKTLVVDEHKFVAIEVKDNGEGIPKDMMDKIFQPFFTKKDALEPDGKPVKGKGLGLSVANQIVEEHEGRIEVESKVGEGSTFRVVLPTVKDY